MSMDETCDSVETQNDAGDETAPEIPEDQWSEDELSYQQGQQIVC